MIKFCLTLTFCLSFAISNFLLAQWSERKTGQDDYLLELEVPSPKTAYALSQTLLLRSDNGGANWSPVVFTQLVVDKLTLFDILFLNDSVGFLAAVSDNKFKKVYKTVNRGVNWTDISPDSASQGLAGTMRINFSDGQNGMLFFGDEEWITSDGGQNWNRKILGMAHIEDVFFLNSSAGFIGGWDGTFWYKGIIQKTMDGGQNWSSDLMPAKFNSQSMIRSVHAPHEDSIYAIAGGFMIRSWDGGQSWDSSSEIQSFEQIHMMDAYRGFAITYNEIYYTDDAGDNWTLQHQHTQTVNEISVVPHAAFVACDSGTFLRLDLVNSVKERPLQKVDVYPNPSRNIFTLQGIEEGTLVEVFSSSGIRIIKLYTYGETKLDLAGYPAGIYLLRCTSSNNTIRHGRLLRY